MLIAVREQVPELLPLVLSAYGAPSCLLFGQEIIQSSEGVQQGDRLGPLLFCLTIYNMVEQLCSQLNVFYLDDGNLGGSLKEVLHDLRSVERIAGELGLQLNLGKTEIICSDTATMNTMLQEVPGFCVTKRERATLLGSPIGGIEGLRDTLMAKTMSLGVVGNRLQHLQAHDVLCLLRHSFALPKLLYTLRTHFSVLFCP